jgi:hypothetical protein
LRKVCGLGLNHKLPLLDEHWEFDLSKNIRLVPFIELVELVGS